MKVMGTTHQSFWTPGSEYDSLAKFNSEVARGLVHTPEWTDKMMRLQAKYNLALKEI